MLPTNCVRITVYLQFVTTHKFENKLPGNNIIQVILVLLIYFVFVTVAITCIVVL